MSLLGTGRKSPSGSVAKLPQQAGSSSSNAAPKALLALGGNPGCLRLPWLSPDQEGAVAVAETGRPDPPGMKETVSDGQIPGASFQLRSHANTHLAVSSVFPSVHPAYVSSRPTVDLCLPFFSPRVLEAGQRNLEFWELFPESLFGFYEHFWHINKPGSSGGAV